jgi:hypothetical protein
MKASQTSPSSISPSPSSVYTLHAAAECVWPRAPCRPPPRRPARANLSTYLRPGCRSCSDGPAACCRCGAAFLSSDGEIPAQRERRVQPRRGVPLGEHEPVAAAASGGILRVYSQLLKIKIRENVRCREASSRVAALRGVGALDYAHAHSCTRLSPAPSSLLLSLFYQSFHFWSFA